LNFSATNNIISPQNSLRRSNKTNNIKLRFKEGERLSTSILHSPNYYSEKPHKINKFQFKNQHSAKNIQNGYSTEPNFYFHKNKVFENITQNNIQNNKTERESPVVGEKPTHVNSQSASNLKELIQKFNKSSNNKTYEIQKKTENIPESADITKEDNKVVDTHIDKENKEEPKEDNCISQKEPIEPNSKLLKKIKQIDKKSKFDEKDIIKKKETTMKNNLLKFIQKEKEVIETSMHNRSRSNINFRPERVNRFESLPPISLNPKRRPNKSILRKSKSKKK
jgi:hypothetical protein